MDEDGVATLSWYRFFNSLFEYLQGSPGTGTVTSVTLEANGSGISVDGAPVTTSGVFKISNTAPDLIVTLTSKDSSLAVGGSYPDFTLETTGQTVEALAPAFYVDNAAKLDITPPFAGLATWQDETRAVAIAPAAISQPDPLPHTVAALPAAGRKGRRYVVTDALAPAYLQPLTGGGAIVSGALDNGTVWVSG